MTYQESIPIAKQLAEKALQKGFDVEAFLILTEINKMDAVPESNIDNEISDIGKMFIDYYYNPTPDALDNLINRFIRTLSEIYHSVNTVEEKDLIKRRLYSFIDVLD